MSDRAEIVKVAAPNDLDGKRFAALLRKSQAGDRKALNELVERYGDRAQFWRAVGDLTRSVENRILDGYAGDNLLIKESVGRRLAEMRVELMGLEPSPLEVMLVERIVACWLRLHVAESAAVRTGISFQQAEYDQKTLDRAHKRHLSAIKALATVRRLQVPAVQVNIAEKQVNVAGGPVSLRDDAERSSA